MNFLKICAAILAGVLLGFVLTIVIRPAQSAKASGLVYVKRAAMGGANSAMGTVIGFSCASNAGEVECYIATQ